MRTSLLLQREPFRDILTATLSRHWSATTGGAQQVAWGLAGPGQKWWGNRFLNCFAAQGTPASAFEVLRREYSRAPTWWRRPLQRAYVEAGTRFPTLRLLANAGFTVQPGVPAAGCTVVLGGNHRLRLLRPALERSTVVLKEGFAARHFENEIILRETLRPRCAPDLLACSRKERWFDETYVVGTPLNRLSGVDAGPWRVEAAANVGREVVEPSLAWIGAQEWGQEMKKRFALLVADCPVAGAKELLALAGALAGKAGSGGRLPVAWSHGDLQDANILKTESRIWVIDWESAARRFAGYDYFVLATAARQRGPGWAGRVAAAGSSGSWFQWFGSIAEISNRNVDKKQWTFAALLEELWYRAVDAAEPAFHVPGGDWPAITREVAAAYTAVHAMK
jgi:hypothetical protein